MNKSLYQPPTVIAKIDNLQYKQIIEESPTKDREDTENMLHEKTEALDNNQMHFATDQSVEQNSKNKQTPTPKDISRHKNSDNFNIDEN